APDVVADPGRALGLEALPRDRAGRIVEAVAAVADEATVGEHAVVADLYLLDARDHHPEVQEAALADRHPCIAGHRDPYAGLQQRARPDLQTALAQRLERVAVQRPAGVGPATGHLVGQPCAVPRAAGAPVPAPLLPPELREREIHRVMFAHAACSKT